MMSDPRPEELIHAEELVYNGRVDEALEIIVNLEKRSVLTPKDQLAALILKGDIHILNVQLMEAVEVGELAHSMSQELGLVPESIHALNLKAQIWYSGKTNEANDIILEVEALLSSPRGVPPDNKAKLNLLYTKYWIYLFKGDVNKALDVALEALNLAEDIKHYVFAGSILLLIGLIYNAKGDYDSALEYAKKGLEAMEKLDFQVGCATGFWVFGQIYKNSGDFIRALEFCKKCLSIEKVSDYIKVNMLAIRGFIYLEKGDLNKAFKYTQQSTNLAEEINDFIFLITNKNTLGEIHRRKGENDLAIKNFQQSLALNEKIGNTLNMALPLLHLLLISLDTNDRDQARQYLKSLENLSYQIENTMYKHVFPLGKALILKMSNRMADKVNAAGLLKQIVKDDSVLPQVHILSIITLCDLLLEELLMYNEPEIIDEIHPLITQLLKIAGEQHSFSWFAEAKLLQAKLALIQMNMEETKQSLTEAQRIAELHGLNLLAQKISDEHDILLEKVAEWDKLKKKDAPMVDRIELASFDGVINRLQGKQAVNPPELVDEEPILLLIMDNSGVSYFNHSFATDWDYSDLFSSFMSAFNTFSSEIFSKSIDRIKIGENTILINPIEPFLACYVIKGQSYPAQQKLTRFSDAIKASPEIWDALKRAVKTSEMLELNNPPSLGSTVKENFM